MSRQGRQFNRAWRQMHTPSGKGTYRLKHPGEKARSLRRYEAGLGNPRRQGAQAALAAGGLAAAAYGAHRLKKRRSSSKGGGKRQRRDRKGRFA